MKAPSQQDMVYFDHIKKRQDNKGCLYATLYGLFCCCCCYETSPQMREVVFGTFWKQANKRASKVSRSVMVQALILF
ncbi:unnamed protein product [Brassica oleracea]